MLENGDKEATIRFLTDLSIKLLGATNAVKDGKWWHGVNKLVGLQQKILDELRILSGPENIDNENTNNEQVPENSG